MLTTMQEEFGASKEAQASHTSVYEKELRKAKKEAFKSSSAVLKLQEELKSTRNTLRITQSAFDIEKQKVLRKEQERFEMEYQLIPMQEQVDKLKQKLRVAEEEREALKTALKEEEVARIAAEGMIALPISQDMNLDLNSSPRKQTSPRKRDLLLTLDENKENLGASPKKALESRRLAVELERERMRREQAEELVDFLRMECMFQCCGCKSASRFGHELTVELDAELAAGVERIRAGMEGIFTTKVESMNVEDGMEIEAEGVSTNDFAEDVPEFKEEPTPEDAPIIQAPEIPMQDGPDVDRSQTFEAESQSNTSSPEDQFRQEEEEEEAWLGASPQHSPSKTVTELDALEAASCVPSEPETPTQPPQHQTTPFRHQHSIRTVTTTTTVPMHFTPISKPLFKYDEDAIEDAENIPPTPTSAAALEGIGGSTFDRAAALAAIEYRRGRAKSIANGHATPRKQMMEGVKERRDISAPALGQKSANEAAGAAKGATTGSLRGRR